MNLIITFIYGLIALELIFDDELLAVRYLHFLYTFFLIGTFLILSYLLWKNWKKALFLIPAIAFIGINYALPLLPTHELISKPTSDNSYSLLSFSLNKSNREYQQAIDIIKQESSDIICLQELPFSEYENFITLLKQNEIIHHHNYSKEKSLMLLSRTPLTPIKTTPYQQSRTSLGGQEISIWNVHSPKSLSIKHYQNLFMRFLLQDLTHDPQEHKIVCGDFNSTPQNQAMRNLFSIMKPAFHAENSQQFFTYPSPNSRFLSPIPFIKIDYLLFSKPFTATHYERLPSNANSDHYPIKATVSL